MVQDIGDRRADTVFLAGQTIDRATLQGLKSASTKSGVSFRYLLAKAAQESSLNPDAQAETSSAAGLFQFTRGTWLDMVKRYGGQYGFADLSRQILETPSGKLTVTDANAEKRILALRQDPETSGLMAAEYARDNAAALEGSLGHVPDTTDLYLAHFLGASGAASLLTAAADTPTRDAADLVPAAAKANPAVFNTPDGNPRSAAQVVNLIRDRFASQMQRFASADTVISDATPVIPAAAPTAPSASGLSKLDIGQALAGNTNGQSPANLMMLDQLIHMITADPMNPSDDSDDDSKDKDPFRPLSSASLRGSDWADAVSRAIAAAPAAVPGTPPAVTTVTPPTPPPAAPDAARAYDAANPGPPRTLDNVI